jgi:hypothetical protein
MNIFHVNENYKKIITGNAFYKKELLKIIPQPVKQVEEFIKLKLIQKNSWIKILPNIKTANFLFSKSEIFHDVNFKIYLIEVEKYFTKEKINKSNLSIRREGIPLKFQNKFLNTTIEFVFCFKKGDSPLNKNTEYLIRNEILFFYNNLLKKDNLDIPYTLNILKTTGIDKFKNSF